MNKEKVSSKTCRVLLGSRGGNFGGGRQVEQIHEILMMNRCSLSTQIHDLYTTRQTTFL